MAKKIEITTDLTLLERILIPGILRQEGKYESLIVIKDLKKKVGLTQDEVKKYDIKTIGEGKESRLSWNEKGAKAKFPYTFTELEKLELKLALKKLNDEEKLNADLIPTYEKFVK